MKSKLLVLALSMFAMSFVAANGAVDSAIAADSADNEVAIAADAMKEVAAEEAADAKKTEETKTAQDHKSCSSCR